MDLSFRQLPAPAWPPRYLQLPLAPEDVLFADDPDLLRSRFGPLFVDSVRAGTPQIVGRLPDPLWVFGVLAHKGLLCLEELRASVRLVRSFAHPHVDFHRWAHRVNPAPLEGFGLVLRVFFPGGVFWTVADHWNGFPPAGALQGPSHRPFPIQAWMQNGGLAVAVTLSRRRTATSVRPTPSLAHRFPRLCESASPFHTVLRRLNAIAPRDVSCPVSTWAAIQAAQPHPRPTRRPLLGLQLLQSPMGRTSIQKTPLLMAA